MPHRHVKHYGENQSHSSKRKSLVDTKKSLNWGTKISISSECKSTQYLSMFSIIKDEHARYISSSVSKKCKTHFVI